MILKRDQKPRRLSKFPMEIRKTPIRSVASIILDFSLIIQQNLKRKKNFIFIMIFYHSYQFNSDLIVFQGTKQYFFSQFSVTAYLKMNSIEFSHEISFESTPGEGPGQ